MSRLCGLQGVCDNGLGGSLPAEREMTSGIRKVNSLK